MKRFLKIISCTIVAIVLLLAVLPMAFKGKIEAIVKQEGNKMLNAQFDFASLDISLLRHFPQASVSLNDFWLKGVGAFENDTLIYASNLTAAVNVMSIFGDQGFELSKILVDDTRVHAIVLEDGTPNWDVMKSTEQTEANVETPTTDDQDSSSFSLQLKKLSVQNLNVVYDDRQGGMYASLKDFDAVCAGNFASNNTTLRLNAETPSLTFRMGGVPFLNSAEIEADVAIAADFAENKFTLNKNTLRVNAIKAAIDGWVDLQDDGIDMDLKLNSNDVGFKEILSLIPAIYAKDFADLRTDGVAKLTAWAKGKLQEECVPAFEAELNVKDAMFRYPSLPAGVDAINVVAMVKNPGGNIDSTTVKVSPFNFVLAGNPFSIIANVSNPISDLGFNVAAKGKLDLGKIKDVYPVENMNLSGVVDADMSVNGRMSYIEHSQFDRVQAAGSVKLNDMTLEMEDIPNVFIKQSKLSFDPRYVELSQTTVNIGDNDITFDSRFENYLGFVFKGTTLKGSLNVSSNRLNLNDFMSEETGAETNEDTAVTEQVVATSEDVLRVPANIDFKMQTRFKEVLFEKMVFSDFNGLVVVKDSKLDMQNVSLKTMGGDVVVNGYYATPDQGIPSLKADFRLQQIGFANAYNELYVIRKLAPIFSGLTGHFSGVIQLDTQLDRDMHPVLNTLDAYGSLSTRNLSLNNVTFISQIADIVKKPSLKDTSVKDLDIDFTIVDGRMSTKPFDVKIGDYVMHLSGTTSLDQTIDYKGTITIPASAGDLSKLGTVDMTIGGTFTSPKVSIDLESLAKNAAKSALQDLGNKLLGGKKEVTQQDSTAVANNTQPSDTATDDKQQKIEDTKKLVNAALDLFKKK